MFRKEDVRFPAEGGIDLSAWLLVPQDRDGPLPAITMARGYAGTNHDQHLHPIDVLANWAVALFAAWVLIARQHGRSVRPWRAVQT